MTTPQTPCTLRPFRAPTTTLHYISLVKHKKCSLCLYTLLYTYTLFVTSIWGMSSKLHCSNQKVPETSSRLHSFNFTDCRWHEEKRLRSGQALTVPNFIEPYCKSSQQPGRRREVSFEAKVVRNVETFEFCTFRNRWHAKLIKIGCVKSKSAGWWPAWTAYSVRAHPLL